MKIIKRGELKPDTKRITCENCGTIFKVEKNECSCTSQMELCTMDLVLTISNVLYAAMYNILIGNKERING